MHNCKRFETAGYVVIKDFLSNDEITDLINRCELPRSKLSRAFARKLKNANGFKRLKELFEQNSTTTAREMFK